MTNYIVDIDKIKEGYYSLNPNAPELTNIELAKLTGKSPQFFTDIKDPNKKKPEFIKTFLKLEEISGLKLTDFIIECEYQNNRENKRKVPIVQLDRAGNLIKTWDSISDASKEGFLISAISLCINGSKKSHKGFIWKKQKDYVE